MDHPRTGNGLSRRSWSLLVASLPLMAQSTTPGQKTQKTAADDVRAVSGRLAETEVPMNVEPAFTFRV